MSIIWSYLIVIFQIYVGMFQSAQLKRINKFPSINLNMKQNIFQARNIPASREKQIQGTNRPNSSFPNGDKIQSDSFNQLVKMFKQFITIATPSHQQTIQKRKQNSYELDARDREILIDLPPLNDKKIERQDLKRWITQVTNTVFSCAFHHYFKEDMTFDQAKIYCAQNVMKNIAFLNEDYSLTSEQFKLIDEHMESKSLSYISKKYPLKDSILVSKKIENQIKQIDNSESIKNNEIANNKIDFQYRQSGNYNDFIMKMINSFVQKINPSEEGELLPDYNQNNLYSKFQQFIGHIFEKVEDEDWMAKHLQIENKNKKNQGQRFPIKQFLKDDSIIKQKTQQTREVLSTKQKYRSAVKEYTQYHIGRKIPEEVALFTPKEIQNGTLVIKHPSIARILTKWCEQLWQQFSTPNYYQNRQSSMFIQKICEVRPLDPWFKEHIDEELVKEKEKILSYMRDVRKDNIEMKTKMLHKEKLFNSKDRYLNKLDQITGKFSINMTENLHHQLIIELNRLIHGLLIVSKEFYQSHLNNEQHQILWPYPPNLITFKIGDVLRCKFSSKQKEVIGIYREIQRINRTSPHIMSIIRIKNRLKKSTNDILINVRFYNTILCEIQLTINSRASNFLKCSNNFQHFIYQLQRSKFGPLAELCSIRKSLDHRFEIYQSIINNQKNSDTQHLCKLNKIKFKLIPNQKPFICNSCNNATYQNNYEICHQKCSKCQYVLCAKCFMKSLSLEQIVKNIVKDERILQFCNKIVTQSSDLKQQNIQYGFLLHIQSKKIKPIFFKKLCHKKIPYLIGIAKNKQLFEVGHMRTDRDLKQLINQNIVVLLKDNQNYIQINSETAVREYVIGSRVKELYSKQKETIELQCLNLSTENCRKILDVGHQNQKKNIKILELMDNNMEELPFHPLDFPNITKLNLSRNPLKIFPNLQPFSHLSQLYLDKCNLSQIPACIFNMVTITKLGFYKNPIVKISDSIQKLQNLTELDFQSCKITSVSEKIGKCNKLQKLSFQGNKLTSLASAICKIKELRFLNISKNNLKNLPQNIGNLTQLIELKLNKNRELSWLPSSISKLSLLRQLNISQTNISSLSDIMEVTTLQILSCFDTKIKSLPPNFGNFSNLIDLKLRKIPQCDLSNRIDRMSNLDRLTIQKCDLLTIPSFQNLNIRDIKIISNTRINMQIDTFASLNSLLTLNLFNNSLDKFPILTDCLKLGEINFNSNNIRQIPDITFLLDLKTLKLSNNKLEEFSQNLLRMSKLTNIDFRHNFISKIITDDQTPTNFFTITQLYLGYNSFTKILPSIYSCKNLKILDLSFNSITSIPKQIEQLENISQLFITNVIISPYLHKTIQIVTNSMKQYCWIPEGNSGICFLCHSKLIYPFYWLKWEEGTQFACTKCVETVSLVPGHQYNYQKNSILIFSNYRQMIEIWLLGSNLQPWNSKFSPAPHSTFSFYCHFCEQNHFSIGIARYICLYCGYTEGKGFVQLCESCLKRYLNGNENERYEIKTILPHSHTQDHPWLRILYQTRGYYEY